MEANLEPSLTFKLKTILGGFFKGIVKKKKKKLDLKIYILQY